MKRTIQNIFFTHGTTLTILALFYIFFDIKNITVTTVFEVLGANIVINLGILLLHNLDTRYLILEYLIDICYIIIVLVTFWKIFGWYNTPILVLVIMAVVIYAFASMLDILIIKKETKIINELLQKRDENTDDSASWY